MSFPTVVYGDEGLFYNDETTAKRHMLGTVGIAPDGRHFAYCEADTSATVAARLYQSITADTNLENENPTVAAAAGAKTVSMDVAATPTAADYVDGYLVDETNGHIYRVRSITAADPTVITLDNDDGLITALTTAMVVALYKNPYKDVLISPTAWTMPLVGVSVQAIAASSFGWLQTRGIACVLQEGTVVAGEAVRRSETTAGAVTAFDADEADDADPGVCGHTIEVAGNGVASAIFLTIS